LEKCAGLRDIGVYKTKVTHDGAKAFKEHLPKCHVRGPDA
jgi:hypothetical protein